MGVHCQIKDRSVYRQTVQEGLDAFEMNRAREAEGPKPDGQAPSIFICDMWGRGSHDHAQNKHVAERKRVHDSSNAPSDVNNFRSEACFVHDQT